MYKNKIIPGIKSAKQIKSKISSNSEKLLKVNNPLNRRKETGAVRETIPALFLFQS
jgi:hypothetical protein